MTTHQNTLSARVDETVAAIRQRTQSAPRIGVVLGSGLGGFADALEGLVKIPYAELPHLPSSSVFGHAGNFCFGRVSGVEVACMQGRVHYYEGHPMEAVVHGARTLARLGVSAVLLTNSSGGLDPSWAPGDMMLVTDHVNLMGVNPLLGPNDDALGPRFPDMTHAYDAALCDALRSVAKREKLVLREGVYLACTGPTYETSAEVTMMQRLGGHAVGMSTVPEVIALRHMGVRVGALSCITNLGAGLSKTPLSHHEVEAMARSRRPELLKLLAGWVEEAVKLYP